MAPARTHLNDVYSFRPTKKRMYLYKKTLKGSSVFSVPMSLWPLIKLPPWTWCLFFPPKKTGGGGGGGGGQQPEPGNSMDAVVGRSPSDPRIPSKKQRSGGHPEKTHDSQPPASSSSSSSSSPDDAPLSIGAGADLGLMYETSRTAAHPVAKRKRHRRRAPKKKKKKSPKNAGAANVADGLEEGSSPYPETPSPLAAITGS